MTLDNDWLDYLNNEESCEGAVVESVRVSDKTPPIASTLYISTKTEIAFLNKELDLYNIFWRLPVTNYDLLESGFVKKQMKFISNSLPEYEETQNNLKEYSELYIEQQLLSKMKADIGAKKYKDVRKISIGLSKKDLLTNRTKKKGAFYNCFVLILRIETNKIFKEFHIKIFNTGKIELPGIQTHQMLIDVKKKLISILNVSIDSELAYREDILKNFDGIESILINSNFDCNYYLDRFKLSQILKYKRNLNVIYDSCSYPGVRCKFYYNAKTVNYSGIKTEENIKSISFMIFRTGSILIVGKCSEEVLRNIYLYIKDLLYEYYAEIEIPNVEKKEKIKHIKRVRKQIMIN
uniref:TATA-box binding protein n=1 Tax=viral metagenome TaxID=1070528 RepID=A0A6C0BWJ4_9ZZZZ